MTEGCKKLQLKSELRLFFIELEVRKEIMIFSEFFFSISDLITILVFPLSQLCDKAGGAARGPQAGLYTAGALLCPGHARGQVRGQVRGQARGPARGGVVLWRV